MRFGAVAPPPPTMTWYATPFVCLKNLGPAVEAGLFFARIGQELAQFIKQLAWLIGLAALHQHPFDLLIEAAIILLGLRHQPTVQLFVGPDGNGHAIRLLHHSLILLVIQSDIL
jgi:hypothetical protein